MMTKASYTDSGKVWSGDMEPVPPELFAALQEFTELTRWTGGGEIEFIEELVPSGEGITFGNCKCNSNINNSVDADNNLPTRWVVDFNPRFPAWIFASTYSGCNLPTLLLQDALRARLNKEQIQQETTLIHVCSAMSLSAISEVPNCEGFSGTANSPSGTCSTSSDACQAPSTTRATTSGVNGAVRTSFVRSVIEVPVVHALHQRSLPSLAAGMAPTKLRTGMAPTGDRESRYDVLPQSICELLLGDECFSDTLTGDLTTIAQDLHRLTSAVQELLSRENVERTPQYVLNVPTLEHTLERLQRAIETSRDVAIRNTSNISNIGGSPSLLPPPGLTRATPPERELMHVQMCLSVKTQPNTLLLRAAERAGYMAECIDMAEVYHSVQDGGFPWGRIVLTGPGKWWDCKSPVERAAELQENQEKQQEQNYDSHLNGRKLHAIFADSLADLKMIVQRLLDPADWLEAEEVGIRWVPLWGPASRFGLNCKDVKVVRQAAEVVAQLPLSYRLGMHFHHACSALGAEQWFALAKGFSVFCREFGTLCGRPVTTLDFGGGFEPYFLESAYSQSQLTALFECVYHTCVRPPSGDGAVHSTTPICVQFELGKSVSEQAGGVLTRILSIREREDLLGGRKKGSDEGKNDSIGEDDDDEATEESASCNAVIMDTTVADISTPNSHAVFWIQRTVAVPAAPNAHQEGTCASTSAVAATALARGATRTTAYSTYKCIPLSAGRTELWGRTCMEWDKIPGGFELPAEAQVGDLLLISGCGAYDMSMQYDFGDGEGRSKNVIVL